VTNEKSFSFPWACTCFVDYLHTWPYIEWSLGHSTSMGTGNCQTIVWSILFVWQGVPCIFGLDRPCLRRDSSWIWSISVPGLRNGLACFWTYGHCNCIYRPVARSDQKYLGGGIWDDPLRSGRSMDFDLWLRARHSILLGVDRHVVRDRRDHSTMVRTAGYSGAFIDVKL